MVEDAELHRGHFSRRPAPGGGALLGRLPADPGLQRHLTERAQSAGVAVIDNESADTALGRPMGSSSMLEQGGRPLR